MPDNPTPKNLDDLENLLAIYREIPMDNGDAAIFTDLRVVMQLDHLGDVWDPAAKRVVCDALRNSEVREIALAVARPDSELLPQDHAMCADIREELRGSGIAVRDPIGLPAAA